MLLVFRRDIFLDQQKCLASALAIMATVAVSLAAPAQTADDPSKALRSEFEAAKASVGAGQLASAQSHYIDAIVLGLRQIAQLSLSAGQVDQAAVDLNSALSLKPDDIEAQTAAAEVFFRKGDVNQAKTMLKSVVAQHPSNARARGLLGRVYVIEEDADNAIAELKASVDLEDDFETSYFLGIAYLKAHKLEEASAWFQRLETKMGDSAALHVLFGRAYLITKFPQQAIPEFSKAIKLDPKYPRAHGFLGYAYLEYYQEEGYPKAREEFEKEVKLYPNEYRVQELLGIANVNLRDFPAAETALLHAIGLKPQEASPYLYLGETYAGTKRFELAVEVLQKYVKLMSHPADDQLREASRAYFLLGENLKRLGRDEEARTALAHSQQLREAKFKYDVQHIFDEKKSSQESGESRVSDRVADVLAGGSPEGTEGTQQIIQHGLGSKKASTPAGTDREKEATKQYRSYVAEILGSSYNDLGVMRAKDGKFLEAAGLFKQAAEWKPGLEGLDRNWGLSSFRAEQYSEAVPPLERQLKAHPEDAFVRQLLGLSYSMLENDAKVVEVLHPFLEHPPDDPGLLLAWGTALMHTHQSGAAAEIFRRMVEQNSDNPSVHLLLGKAYAHQENYPGALSEFSDALRLNPQIADAHYYSGLVFLQQNEFDSAAQEFHAELALHPNEPRTMYHLGYTLLLQGQLSESVALFRDVVKTMPKYELAYFQLGRALLQQGDSEGAIENLETAKKLAPDHDAAYFQLSQAYRRSGRMQDAALALATYQKLIEANRMKKRQSLETETP